MVPGRESEQVDEDVTGWVENLEKEQKSGGRGALR